MHLSEPSYILVCLCANRKFLRLALKNDVVSLAMYASILRSSATKSKILQIKTNQNIQQQQQKCRH